MQEITVVNGSYRNIPVENVTFQLVKELQEGARGFFVTVRNDNHFPGSPETIRIRVNGPEDIVGDGFAPHAPSAPKQKAAPETDEQIIARIRERFEILDIMSRAVSTGSVRGLIVSGPPGVGKSFGVYKVLEERQMMRKMRGYENCDPVIIKGTMTAISLYQILYDNKNEGDIVVFDDCDSILFDDVSLNMLKAVLDSDDRRRVSWKSESHILEKAGVPDEFEFRGGVVFITNVDFENTKSKKLKDHLDALMSRCHFLDLKMPNMRDRLLRIKQIVSDGMLTKWNFSEEESEDLVDWMFENQNRLREVSLRAVTKIADLRKLDPQKWERLASATCMK